MSTQRQAAEALRAMTPDELGEHLRDQRRKLFEVRFQQATGQVENHRQIRRLRREIARTMTMQIEAARDASVIGAAGGALASETPTQDTEA